MTQEQINNIIKSCGGDFDVLFTVLMKILTQVDPT
jgi:hypothetical protein